MKKQTKEIQWLGQASRSKVSFKVQCTLQTWLDPSARKYCPVCCHKYMVILNLRINLYVLVSEKELRTWHSMTHPRTSWHRALSLEGLGCVPTSMNRRLKSASPKYHTGKCWVWVVNIRKTKIFLPEEGKWWLDSQKQQSSIKGSRCILPLWLPTNPGSCSVHTGHLLHIADWLMGESSLTTSAVNESVSMCARPALQNRWRLWLGNILPRRVLSFYLD